MADLADRSGLQGMQACCQEIAAGFRAADFSDNPGSLDRVLSSLDW
jgi:hypothetical protein